MDFRKEYLICWEWNTFSFLLFLLGLFTDHRGFVSGGKDIFVEHLTFMEAR